MRANQTSAFILFILSGTVACGGPEFNDEVASPTGRAEGTGSSNPNPSAGGGSGSTAEDPSDETGGHETGGPETGNPGDETGNPGDETGNPGDETGNPGDETGNPGDETGNPPFDPAAYIAPFDNDALQNPAISEILRITGLRELVYYDQISAQNGDFDDWVEFELPNNSNPNQRIVVELSCEFSGQEPGNTQVRVTLFENGEEDLSLRALCNEGPKNLTVDNTKVQTARVYFSIPPVDAQVLVDYELRVVGFN